MPKRGGKREGAGRKPGSKNVRSRALAERLIGEGYDPDILVKIGFKVAADPKTKPSEKIYAIATVLPFLVPKLSAVEVSGGGDGEPVRIKVVRSEPKKP